MNHDEMEKMIYALQKELKEVRRENKELKSKMDDIEFEMSTTFEGAISESNKTIKKAREVVQSGYDQIHEAIGAKTFEITEVLRNSNDTMSMARDLRYKFTTFKEDIENKFETVVEIVNYVNTAVEEQDQSIKDASTLLDKVEGLEELSKTADDVLNALKEQDNNTGTLDDWDKSQIKNAFEQLTKEIRFLGWDVRVIFGHLNHFNFIQPEIRYDGHKLYGSYGYNHRFERYDELVNWTFTEWNPDMFNEYLS